MLKSVSLKKKIFVACLVIFAIINIIWILGMLKPYLIFQSRMKNHSGYQENGRIVDDEHYCYSVHYPTYLYWQDGNLSVSAPLGEVGKEGDKTICEANGSSMIIWINRFSGTIREIGVILVIDGVSEQIYLTDSKTARYKDQQCMVDQEQQEIIKLFEKAEDAWKLKMPWGK